MKNTLEDCKVYIKSSPHKLDDAKNKAACAISCICMTRGILWVWEIRATTLGPCFGGRRATSYIWRLELWICVCGGGLEGSLLLMLFSCVCYWTSRLRRSRFQGGFAFPNPVSSRRDLLAGGAGERAVTVPRFAWAQRGVSPGGGDGAAAQASGEQERIAQRLPAWGLAVRTLLGGGSTGKVLAVGSGGRRGDCFPHCSPSCPGGRSISACLKQVCFFA